LARGSFRIDSTGYRARTSHNLIFSPYRGRVRWHGTTGTISSPYQFLRSTPLFLFLALLVRTFITPQFGLERASSRGSGLLNPLLRLVNIRRKYDNVSSILRFDPEVLNADVDKQDCTHSFADHAAGLSFDRHRLQLEFVDSFSRGPEATKSTRIIENIPPPLTVNGPAKGRSPWRNAPRSPTARTSSRRRGRRRLRDPNSLRKEFFMAAHYRTGRSSRPPFLISMTWSL
jgi:hypothetical protein